MKSFKNKAIRFALICVAAGLLIGFVALATLDFNFFEVGTMEPVTSVHEPTEAFAGIMVRAASSDVQLLPAEDGRCIVVCDETDRISHTVDVEGKTLVIRSVDHTRWYERIGFVWNMSPMKVTIYLPERAYDDLYIRTASGDVDVPGDFSFAQAEVDGVSGSIRFVASVEGELLLKSVSGSIQVGGVAPEALTVESTSGSVTVEAAEVGEAFSCKTVSGDQRINRVTCQNVSIYSTSGSVTASDLIASEHIGMEAVSGSLKLERCDADTLWLKTVSGDVTGTLRTEKTFLASTVSGSVHVPDTAVGGVCEVKTVSGSIQLDVLE